MSDAYAAGSLTLFPCLKLHSAPSGQKPQGSFRLSITHLNSYSRQWLTAYVHGFIYLSCNNQLTNNFRIHRGKHVNIQEEVHSISCTYSVYVCILMVCMHSLCSWFGYLCACVLRIYSECLSD